MARLSDYLDDSYRGRKTREQRVHLAQLVHHLEQLEENDLLRHFDMRTWGDPQGDFIHRTLEERAMHRAWMMEHEGRELDVDPSNPECGTTACALGHAVKLWPDEIRLRGRVYRDGIGWNQSVLWQSKQGGRWESSTQELYSREKFGMSRKEFRFTFGSPHLSHDGVVESLRELINRDSQYPHEEF